MRYTPLLATFLTIMRMTSSHEALVQRVSTCETLDGWSGNAELVVGAKEGDHAVAAAMPAGEVGFLQHHFADAGIDLAQCQWLSFWWKVEGDGLTSFMVKVRNHPLVGGMEAVYVVWGPEVGAPPGEWQRATLTLTEPRYDTWGGKPDLEARYVTFRTETTRDADVQLLVDDVVAVPPTVSWDIVDARLEAGGARATVGLENLLRQPVSVRLGSGDRVLATLGLAAHERLSHSLDLPVPADVVQQLQPFQALRVPIWMEIEGLTEFRTERTATSMKHVKLPPHPRLLFNREGVEALKARTEHHDWARKRWEALRREADGLLEEEVKLPPRGGNWWHWYVCPKHGAGLKTGKQVAQWQWEHVCSIDGEVFHGDPTRPDRDFDGCVLSGVHSRWSSRTRALGVAYQVTGDRRYADKAREILLAYTAMYPTYPLHNVHGAAKVGGGRAGPQSLDESTWLIPLCQGADLVWDTLSEDERRALAEQVVLPAVHEVILPHRMGVHNIQCWKNSAVGMAGFLLDDHDLIHEAIYNPDRGFVRQMEEGVGPDGQWWEGAWGYHFYTLMALWSLTEAARNCGVNLYGEPLKAMFDAPLELAMPNLRLPAFNDSGEVDVGRSARYYELAYARYGEPLYATALAQGDRRDDFALWFGADELPAAPAMTWQSANYPNTGYAVLARGEGDQATWLCLKYGPHGGGHGHPDKLSFVLYARGAVVAPDPGTARYGTPIQRSWYRTTLAHSTLVVDQTSQGAAEGKCLAFGSKHGVDYVMAEAGPIADGVRFVRTAALVSEDLLLFVDQIACDRERLLDIVYHQHGTWEDMPPGEPWEAPDKSGYGHLRDATVRETDSAVTLAAVVAEGQRVAVVLAPGEPTQVITATGVGAHVEDRVPLVLFRRRTQATALAWCIALDGEPPQLEQLAVRSETGEALPPHVAAAWRVVSGEGQGRVLLVNPGTGSVRLTLADGSEEQTNDPVRVF